MNPDEVLSGGCERELRKRAGKIPYAPGRRLGGGLDRRFLAPNVLVIRSPTDGRIVEWNTRGMPTEGNASSAPSTEECHRPWAVFIVWSVVGGAYSLALIGILSIGIFVLPVAIVATVLAARLLSTQRGLVGLLAGLGVPPLYVAFLNRGGPEFGWMSPGKWWRALFRFNGRNVSFGRERPVSTPQPVALVGNRSPAGCCCRLDLSHFNPKATVPRDRGSASGELDSLSLQFERSVAVSVEAERVPLRTDCEPVSLIGDALPRGSQA